MDAAHSITNELPKNWQVTFFRIYKTQQQEQHATAKVFANGRQQAIIHVAIAIADLQGSPITLTSDQAADIVKLIHYDDRTKEIPITAEPGDYADDHSASRVSRGYTWNENLINQVNLWRRDVWSTLRRKNVSGHPWNKDFFSSTCKESTVARIPPWELLPTTPRPTVAPHAYGCLDLSPAANFPAQTVILTLYLSTSTTSPGLAIAAQAKNGESIVAHTATPGIRDDDGYGNGEGLYNSSVTLAGFTPYRPPGEDAAFGPRNPDGTLRRTVLRYGLNTEFAEIWITLGFNGNLLRLNPAPPIPGDDRKAWQHGHANDGLLWSVFLVTAPGDTHYKIDRQGAYELRDARSPGRVEGNVPGMVQNLIGEEEPITNRSSQRMVFGQLSGSVDWRFYNESGHALGNKLFTPIRFIDEHGTLHVLELVIDEQKSCRLRSSTLHRDAAGRSIPSLPMVTQASDPEEATMPGTRIEDPVIHIRHDKVYTNGNQQAQVDLDFVVIRDKTPSKLTPEERQTLRLVDYRTGDIIPLPEDSTQASGVRSDTQYHGYLPHPDANGTTELPSINKDYATLYISTDSGALGSTILIGFQVTLDVGTGDEVVKVTYRTTGHWWREDGDATYDPDLDTHELNKITPQPPPTYTPDHYRLSPSEPAPGTPPHFNLAMQVSIEHLGRSIGLRTMTCEPAGMIHWMRNDGSANNPCFIGHAAPAHASVIYDGDLHNQIKGINEAFVGPETTNPVDDRGIIMLCGRQGLAIPQFSNPPRGPVTIRMVDMYGTPHTRTLAFTPGTRSELRFTA